MNDVSRELGGALGIAVLGSRSTSAYRAGIAGSASVLPPALAGRARSSLAAAEQIGRRLGPNGHQLVAHAQSAFVDGFGRALLGGAAALLLGALFVAARAPGRAESTANAGGQAAVATGRPREQAAS